MSAFQKCIGLHTYQVQSTLQIHKQQHELGEIACFELVANVSTFFLSLLPLDEFLISDAHRPLVGSAQLSAFHWLLSRCTQLGASRLTFYIFDLELEAMCQSDPNCVEQNHSFALSSICVHSEVLPSTPEARENCQLFRNVQVQVPTRSTALTRSTNSNKSLAKMTVFHFSPIYRLFSSLCSHWMRS